MSIEAQAHRALGDQLERSERAVDVVVAASATKTEADAEGRPEELTDSGNARRLVERYGDRMRWVKEGRKWITLDDDALWRVDSAEQVIRWAQASVRHLFELASSASHDAAKALSKHAVQSLSRSKLVDAVELAKSIEGVSVSAQLLDADPWSLSVRNGVVDLRTGSLRPRAPGDLITKCARAQLEPGQGCPLFERFLLDVMSGDADMVKFLQKLVGYAMYGANPEQLLVLLSGVGANGKSTLLSVVIDVLGDYALTTPCETFMARRDGAPSNDLARLPGARLVFGSEAERGKRLAENLVKRLTGNDRVTARFLFSEYFEFTPQFLACLAVNHKPLVSGDDPAIWRRLLVVPFDFIVPVADRDPRLVEKLLAERDGILEWAVEGCLRWQREGLEVPDRCQFAADSYRESMDTIGQWLDECTQVGVGSSKASALYASYSEWCKTNGHTPLSNTRFGLTLTERGFEKQKLAAGIFYRGLAVNA